MSMSEELGKLGELHQRGVLTDDEFARAKTRLIGSQPGSAASSFSSMAQSGVPFVAGFNSLRGSTTDRWLGGVCGGLAPAISRAPACGIPTAGKQSQHLKETGRFIPARFCSCTPVEARFNSACGAGRCRAWPARHRSRRNSRRVAGALWRNARSAQVRTARYKRDKA